MQNIIEIIKLKLTEELPGNSAFRLLAPRYTSNDILKTKPNLTTRNSAVLLLLSIKKELLNITLTLRSNDLLTHGGQISFPGGKIDKNETVEKAAIRETFEEVGIKPHIIEILGTLTPLYVLPSNSLIHPVVGFSKQYLDFIINPDEVQEVFTVPVDYFSFESIKIRQLLIGKEEVDVPYWELGHSVPLWGATAMILSEFLTIYQKINLIRTI